MIIIRRFTLSSAPITPIRADIQKLNYDSGSIVASLLNITLPWHTMSVTQQKNIFLLKIRSNVSSHRIPISRHCDLFSFIYFFTNLLALPQCCQTDDCPRINTISIAVALTQMNNVDWHELCEISITTYPYVNWIGRRKTCSERDRVCCVVKEDGRVWYIYIHRVESSE